VAHAQTLYGEVLEADLDAMEFYTLVLLQLTKYASDGTPL
jgi:hypothetical protein